MFLSLFLSLSSPLPLSPSLCPSSVSKINKHPQVRIEKKAGGFLKLCVERGAAM